MYVERKNRIEAGKIHPANDTSVHQVGLAEFYVVYFLFDIGLLLLHFCLLAILVICLI